MDEDATSSAKIKHLELIQSIVGRMANNSFLIKGWSVTISAALFALAAKDSNPKFAILAILPIFAFWYLDAFYLRQERIFRHFYNKVLDDKEGKIAPMSLNTHAHACDVHGVGKTMLAECNIVFHGVILIAAFILFTLLYGPSCFL